MSDWPPEPTLVIEPEVARRVLDHALTTAPDECCGVLMGPGPGHADQVIEASNVHTNPRTRYEIDPETLLEAVQAAEKPGVEMVGFYHSHPRGLAEFSETDKAQGAWQGLDYLLVSLSPLTFVGGRWDGTGFEDLHVHVPKTPG